MEGTMPSQPIENGAVMDRVERPCKECASLNLNIEKFVIEDDKAAEIRPSLDSLRLANERFRLGTLDSITERAETCPLCRLVINSIAKDVLKNVDATKAVCHLTWEMDGRLSVDPRRALRERRTRRLRVTWSDALLKAFESYLVLAAPMKYANSDLDYPKQLNRETQFLGRRFGATENKKNLIREFLRLCENNHDRRCTEQIGIENPFMETLMEPYFGVIDIENDRLVPLPFEGTMERLEFEPYAAVSYVWGDTGRMDYRTKISNIQSRRKSGGLAATIRKLPKALVQSIRLVHDLGIRYAWIDALCIVQDSSHSWSLNSRAMHLIYGNATLTICAADGDSRTGLLALDEGQRPQQQIGVYADGVHLILHQPSEISIQTSKWNTRAWTFQERLLSKRCLIFTRGQIYFQCRSTGMSEDVFADGKGRGWSLDLVQAPLQMLTELKKRSMCLKRMRTSTGQLLERMANREAHDSYGRRLTGGPLDEIQFKRRLDFALTLPEDPYHVRITASSQSAGDLKEFPDQSFLQFFTWRASFHIVRSSESNVEGDNVGAARARCHITDRRGDKCGSVVVNKTWLEKYEATGQTTFEFIAISDAKSFSQQEFPVWTYYLPKERVDSEWDLYFVLLVEPFPEEGIHRRVALGKVFKAAFTLSDDEWKEIILG
ncbi:uncharacterized protein J4E87_007694 [Alternaria ethzedia]|uniref:uncharacterized protein n=1 Tax=Alternaria ethzedia TaxID=181014 RepID=UPI0020C4C53F|nr:uncharacterized protein J4E87_007694 [Alternaria ethzedia]KAI4619107.1 hypothetical protein J4E87_007694 [Alternaria ethzedia]